MTEELQDAVSPSSSSSSPSSWEDKARQEQQKFLGLLGTCMYDSYKRRLPSICNLLLNQFCKCLEDDGMCANESEMVALRMKIGFAIHGQPTKTPSEENGFTGYTEDKLKWISQVFDQIVSQQQCDKVLMCTIFISLEADDGSGNVSNFPVFRIPKPENEWECCFVDLTGRLYRDWNDFLATNKLYKSKCCYPKDGIYSGDAEGKVELCYGLTPASTLTGQVINHADKGACIGSFVAGVCTFIPPIALPSAAACGLFSVYSMVRSAVELVDRSKHAQSLKDREAARQWLSLGGTVFGLGSAGGTAVLKMMAREGRAVSRMVTGLVTGLSFSSTAVNGINLVDHALTLREREEWLSLESAQLAMSLLFFAHSLTNFKTARSVVVETQNQVLNDHGVGLSRRQRSLFAGMQRETLISEPDPIVGRAKIIRDLNRISNKSEFFGQILRSNKEARKSSQPVQKVKFGGLSGAHDGPVSGGQTLSPQDVSLRQTAGFTATANRNPYFLGAQPRYVQPHEPGLVTQIRVQVQEMLCSNMPMLLRILDEVCGKFQYGRLCMSAIRIVFDMYHCDNVQEAMHILRNVLKLWEELVAEFWAQRSQRGASDRESGAENGENLNNDSEIQQSDVEEIMNEVAEDADFVPEHFYSLGNVEIEEQVYHFPVDHQHWNENGELEPEHYIWIAQNAFGSNAESCCNIVCQGNTANVYVENHGLVKITSSVQEQVVILKKFKKPN